MLSESEKTRRTKGFTLIELLIVVAIIAILAAIAVPNFLEAQTRAKVSRVKADMRSLATAIESYSVDWNRVPIGMTEAKANFNTFGLKSGTPGYFANYRGRIYSQLTTPVAFITSVPQDPFTVQQSTTELRALYYTYLSIVVMKNQPHIPTAMQKGYTWTLESNGPMRLMKAGNDASLVIAGMNKNMPGTFVYDPSNGTMSWGLLIRTNKGIYTGPGS